MSLLTLIAAREKVEMRAQLILHGFDPDTQSGGIKSSGSRRQRLHDRLTRRGR
jgi:hypothetical protein